jgi:hypothetical protein
MRYVPRQPAGGLFDALFNWVEAAGGHADLNRKV